MTPETIADMKRWIEENDGNQRMRMLLKEVERLQSQRAQARERLAKIVVTEGDDAGVVLLSSLAPSHIEKRDGASVRVYDREYFSPLGDAMMELWKGLGE